MSTNITFESNVYPVNGSVPTDKVFLSKIWDYNRLHSINNRYYSNVPFSSLQQRIIKEQPTCSLNKEDPCWGMIKTASGYRWICMCTKTECPGFSSCRAGLPYDSDKEREFVPRMDLADEYGYKQFSTEYLPAPIIIGDDTPYESLREFSHRQTVDKPQTAPNSTFSKLLREVAPVSNAFTSQAAIDVASNSVVENDPVENCTSHEQSKEGLIKEELTIVDVAEKEPLTEETTIEELVSAAFDIQGHSLNVFEHFSECSQEEIITASSKENFFVDAGPGTGKTYTLIQKLNHMVTNEGVEADGILVLCFTNAAVDEIKDRLRNFVIGGADRSLVNVDVRTFHSFAWWLINQANTVLTDRGWQQISRQSLSYEMSLIKACEIVSRFGKDVVGNWEYFIVDEVQDLTNSLGHFVLRIVNACLSVNCGITVLGDACQAIYDYDQDTRSAPLKSGEFYKALFRKLYGRSRFVYLTENHRQDSELISLTTGLRTAILSADPAQMERAVTVFSNTAEKVTSTGSIINKDFLDSVRNGGSVSMLFRNNGQTLKMSSDFQKRGISHTLNITETRSNFAPWIADIFGTYRKEVISEDKFLDLFESTTGQTGDTVWSRLQKLLHTDNDVLNIRDLLDAIALSRIDDALLRASKSQNVVVSNIHRSKGREYDCVIVDKSFVESFTRESPEDEYKTLYVAITRPKSKLLLAPLQDKTGIKVLTIFSTGRKRWGKTKSKKIAYLEFDGTKDISCDLYALADPAVFEEVQIGDSVMFKRNLKKGKISYSIIHEDSESVLGTIDDCCPYVQDYIAYMKLDKDSYIEMPASINDLYVSGIYSQVVDSQYLELHPEIRAVAPNGVWKWIELVGIGHADYDVY